MNSNIKSVSRIMSEIDTFINELMDAPFFEPQGPLQQAGNWRTYTNFEDCRLAALEYCDVPTPYHVGQYVAWEACRDEGINRHREVLHKAVRDTDLYQNYETWKSITEHARDGLKKINEKIQRKMLENRGGPAGGLYFYAVSTMQDDFAIDYWLMIDVIVSQGSEKTNSFWYAKNRMQVWQSGWCLRGEVNGLHFVYQDDCYQDDCKNAISTR